MSSSAFGNRRRVLLVFAAIAAAIGFGIAAPTAHAAPTAGNGPICIYLEP